MTEEDMEEIERDQMAGDRAAAWVVILWCGLLVVVVSWCLL
jgi:hypothetical protein